MAEIDLKAAKGRAEEIEGELRLALGRADKAEAAVEQEASALQLGRFGHLLSLGRSA